MGQTNQNHVLRVRGVTATIHPLRPARLSQGDHCRAFSIPSDDLTQNHRHHKDELRRLSERVNAEKYSEIGKSLKSLALCPVRR